MTGLGFWHDNNLQPKKRKGNPAYSKTNIKLDEIKREKWAGKSTSSPGLFPLNLGRAGKDPGIGWSRDSKHPKILGAINYNVMNV